MTAKRAFAILAVGQDASCSTCAKAGYPGADPYRVPLAQLPTSQAWPAGGVSTMRRNEGSKPMTRLVRALMVVWNTSQRP